MCVNGGYAIDVLLAGLEELMHYYATNLLPYRITANAVAPSLIDSAIVRKMEVPPLAAMPLGRLGHPQEVCRLFR